MTTPVLMVVDDDAGSLGMLNGTTFPRTATP